MYLSDWYMRGDDTLTKAREVLFGFIRGKKKRERFRLALDEYNARFTFLNNEETFKQANRINDLVNQLDHMKQQYRELDVELHVERARTVAAQQVIAELAARVANGEIRAQEPNIVIKTKPANEENSGDYFPGKSE